VRSTESNHTILENVAIEGKTGFERLYAPTSSETVICEPNLRKQCVSPDGCQHFTLPYQWQVILTVYLTVCCNVGSLAEMSVNAKRCFTFSHVLNSKKCYCELSSAVRWYYKCHRYPKIGWLVMRSIEYGSNYVCGGRPVTS
jgi:hypothetical protein